MVKEKFKKILVKFQNSYFKNAGQVLFFLIVVQSLIFLSNFRFPGIVLRGSDTAFLLGWLISVFLIKLRLEISLFLGLVALFFSAIALTLGSVSLAQQTAIFSFLLLFGGSIQGFINNWSKKN